MAKPTDLPIWATDANYPAGPEAWNGTPTKVAPVLGKLQLGYEPEEEPPAQGDNWWRNVVYQWIAWLDEGDLGELTVSDLTVDNIHVLESVQIDLELTVNGAVYFESTLDVAGEIHRPLRRRTFGPKMDGHSGAGTGSYNLSVGFDESWILDTSGGKAYRCLDEFVPGDRIQEIRLVWTSTAPVPTVTLRHEYANGSAGDELTEGATVVLVGGRSVTRYTRSPLFALGHDSVGGALDPAFAMRHGLVIEANGNDTRIYGIEVYYDHVDIPADT